MRCSKCKTEYPYSEKNRPCCPQCGQAPAPWQRWWSKRSNILIVIGALLFIGLISAAIITKSDALISITTILVVNLAARFVSQLMLNLLRKRLKKEPTGSLAFFIPPYFNHALYFSIILLMPIEILMPLSWLNQANTHVEAGLGIGLPLVLSPLMLFALLMIRYNSGAVVLTSSEIIRYYPFTKKKMLLSEIQRINTNAFGFPLGMAVMDKHHRMKFPRAISGYPELLERLKISTNLPPQIEKKANARLTSPLEFPITLGISQRRMTIEILSMVGLVLICLAISLSGLWGPLFNGTVPPFDEEDIKTIVYVFLLFNVVFVPMLVLAGISAFKKNKPVQIHLIQEEISIKQLSGEVITYKSNRLQKVWLHPVSVRMRSSYGDAVVTGETTTYEVHLKFTDEEDIIFNHSQIRMFGLYPEEFVEVFHILYKIG